MTKIVKKEKKAPSESASHKTKEHLITTKRSGRYLVRTLKGKVVNGAEKTRILVEAKLVQAAIPKGDAPAHKASAPEAAPAKE